jgi:hypothetical protein
MTTEYDLELGNGADQALSPREDYCELRGGLAALCLIVERLELGRGVDAGDTLIDALEFVITPMSEACERLGEKLRFIEG